MYLDFPKNAPNYQKVVSYGKTVHGYYVQVEKNKPKPKTKLEKYELLFLFIVSFSSGVDI